MLTEKAQLLTAELNQQEQDANELVRELQQQLAAAQGKLQEYQAAEGILDKAVLGAAAAGGWAGLGMLMYVDVQLLTQCNNAIDHITRHGIQG